MTGNELLAAICRLAGPDPEPAYVDSRVDAEQVADLAERMGMDVTVPRRRSMGLQWMVERTDR